MRPSMCKELCVKGSPMMILILLLITKANADKEGTIASMLTYLVNETQVNTLLPWLQSKIENDDEQILKVTNWLQGTKAKEIGAFLASMEEGQEIFQYFLSEGIDLKIWAEKIKEFLKLPHETKPITNQARQLVRLLDEAIAMLDVNHCLAVLERKVEEGKEMQKVSGYLRSATWKSFIQKLWDYPPFKQLQNDLLSEGVDINSIYELITTIVAV